MLLLIDLACRRCPLETLLLPERHEVVNFYDFLNLKLQISSKARYKVSSIWIKFYLSFLLSIEKITCNGRRGQQIVRFVNFLQASQIPVFWFYWYSITASTAEFCQHNTNLGLDFFLIWANPGLFFVF